jgi:hypothetical protein
MMKPASLSYLLRSFSILLPAWLVLLFSFPLFGQEPEKSEPDTLVTDTLQWETSRVVTHFQLGASAGFASLMGELKNDINTPVYQRIGGQLFFDYAINPSITLGISLIQGTVYGQIRSDSSSPIFTNLNVKTMLLAPQVRLMYNFGGLYRNQMPGIFQPWCYLGFEPLFFNPYSDLTTDDGTPYYYWRDGSIRNMPELPENTGTAAYLQRDYFYESFLRDANLDGFGTYKGFTFAIPIGAGLDINLNETFTISLGCSWHYTFTDYLDDITYKSGALDPARAIGNKRNDSFLMIHAGITFKYYELDDIQINSLNITAPSATFLPYDFLPFDLNGDHIIQREEVLKAIESLFSDEEGSDPELVSLLVDFFNIQQTTGNKIHY